MQFFLLWASQGYGVPRYIRPEKRWVINIPHHSVRSVHFQHPFSHLGMQFDASLTTVPPPQILQFNHCMYSMLRVKTLTVFMWGLYCSTVKITSFSDVMKEDKKYS